MEGTCSSANGDLFLAGSCLLLHTADFVSPQTLTLRGAGALMIPYFNCTASNAAGFTWSIARVLYLQTLKPAETYPANIGIFSDVVNIIPCRATGGPNLRYSWSTVTLSGSTTPVNPANVLTNNSLLLPVNRNRVSMTYRCTVRSLLPWDMTRDAQAPLHIDRTVTILSKLHMCLVSESLALCMFSARSAFCTVVSDIHLYCPSSDVGYSINKYPHPLSI